MTPGLDASNSESFREQLRKFREDDEIRWKYDAEELQRQSKILAKAGRTDSRFKEELRNAGINVAELERHSEEEAERGRRIHDDLQKIQPPPWRANPKDQRISRQLPDDPSDTWIYPPAYTGWGNAEDCGFNVPLAEWNIEVHRTGDGWGWEATGDPKTQYCTLWFYYIPAKAGILEIQPQVNFQGHVVVFADDHWYTSTGARLQLKLHFDLYQHYWDGEQTTTIIDEDRGHANSVFWVEEHRSMSKSLTVSANDVVWIKLTTSLFGSAHSSYAHVDCDFRTGAERRIQVEGIRIALT
jgi:hypothetical protein